MVRERDGMMGVAAACARKIDTRRRRRRRAVEYVGVGVGRVGIRCL